jgi:hypothetical protein
MVHLLRSPVKALFQNIALVSSVTLAVSHVLMSPLKFVAELKMFCI